MKCICGNCKKEVETDGFPKDWVVSKYSMHTERKETGENPLGAGVVRAFCSEGCEKKAHNRHLKGAIGN